MKTFDAFAVWCKGAGRRLRLFSFVVPMLLILLVGAWGFGFLAHGMGDKVSSESLQVMRMAIARSVVECYALEGFYPPDVDYLTDRYGISIDKSQIFVDYAYLGSNLMPNITVLPAMRGVSADE